jgi:gas vesicle protein/polyhydroxyalkanoate synthesis regulator phasin
MPTGTARTADDITESIRTLVDRLADAKLTHELAKRGHDVAEEVGTFADEAWRESKPMRRDARKRFERAIVDASKWSDRTWRKTVRPALKDLWKRRTVAMSAAGAAVPAAGAVIDDAAIRLGVKRERRHWGAFFFGLLVGAAIGAIAALLSAPKRGSEIRDELGARAEELATKAKDEWVPIFERATNGAGEILGEPAIETSAEDATAAVQEAAADAGETVGDAGEQAASETAEAINDAYDAADKETPA